MNVGHGGTGNSTPKGYTQIVSHFFDDDRDVLDMDAKFGELQAQLKSAKNIPVAMRQIINKIIIVHRRRRSRFKQIKNLFSFMMFK